MVFNSLGYTHNGNTRSKEWSKLFEYRANVLCWHGANNQFCFPERRDGIRSKNNLIRKLDSRQVNGVFAPELKFLNVFLPPAPDLHGVSTLRQDHGAKSPHRSVADNGDSIFHCLIAPANTPASRQARENIAGSGMNTQEIQHGPLNNVAQQ
jgi:hypothetical protein